MDYAQVYEFALYVRILIMLRYTTL